MNTTKESLYGKLCSYKLEWRQKTKATLGKWLSNAVTV